MVGPQGGEGSDALRQTAGAGLAAHLGARCRCLSLREETRCSCAADGERAVGRLQASGHRVVWASYRRAQDLTRHHPAAFGGSRPTSSADGGTVGGSADRLVSCLRAAADCALVPAGTGAYRGFRWLPDHLPGHGHSGRTATPLGKTDSIYDPDLWKWDLDAAGNCSPRVPGPVPRSAVQFRPRLL